MAFLKMSVEEIKDLIASLGYSKKSEDIYSKKYKEYEIKIDFKKEKIIYKDEKLEKSKQISLDDETTSNFARSENFVVLECVDRLLEKGYSPSSLYLEKRYKTGHKESGKLDILVKCKDSDTPYLMIECKTWGQEFEKEINRMLKDGGQLFSYFKQNQNTQYLCLYTSKLINNKIKLEYKTIKVEENLQQVKGEVKEIFARWNKQFSSNGIFDKDINPYGIQFKPLLRRDLRKIEEQDSGIIFNQFQEILRQNVVSDKPNAFNKIFNLFLCKVYDENKNEHEELEFQWKDNQDDFKSLLSRLNTLYKKGMEFYLQKKVVDYSKEDINNLIEKSIENKEEILKKFEELRLYKNQEFAFIEVYDEKSFEENSRIVKEVVKLLQGYKIRYSHKQQFLGEFFEKLLNSGFKQESGQFFTPVPLVRFILNSLPIKENMQEKLNNGDKEFIPYVIDYACGSGHFLTECMDIIQETFKELIAKNPIQEKTIKKHKENQFEWAKDYIYGIERDYRLVKTTKLSCFLNGDGEANIINTSGLAPFNSFTAKDHGILFSTDDSNEVFDILIANPPYSVNNFINTLPDKGKGYFELTEEVTDSSSKIELFFVERMKQLVKPNGMVGIILPISILNNTDNLHYKAREIILSNFEIKVIVKLNGNVFMETGTSTIVLFLIKRKNRINLKAKEDYIKMSKDKNILIVDSLEKEDAKDFLGYEFSKRRGYEGIKNLNTQHMVNIKSRDDEEKVSYYILKSMKNENLKLEEIPNNLIKYFYKIDLKDCFEFEEEQFNNTLNINKKKKFKSKYPIIKLENFIFIKKGKTVNKKYKDGNYPVVAGGEKYPYKYKFYNYNEEIITLSASGKAGYVWYHNYPLWASDCYILKTNSDLLIKYLFYFLKEIQDEIYKLKSGITIKHIYSKDIKNIKIPIPPLEIQKEIVTQLESYDKKIENCNAEIKELKNKIKSYKFEGIEHKLGDICHLVRGPFGSDLKKDLFVNYGYKVYEQKNCIKNDLTLGDYFISNEKFEAMKKFAVSENDILMSCSGTIGKTVIVKKPFKKGIINQALLKITVKNNIIIPEYLNYLIKNLIHFDNHGVGITNIKDIKILKNIKIPIPPLEIQKEIVTQLESYDKKIENCNAEIKELKNKQKEILNRILEIEIIDI